MATRILVLRATLAAYAGARRSRRQLERELAAYRTPAELLEIRSILGRYPDWQTHEVRSALARQASDMAQQHIRTGTRTYR